MGGFFGAVGKHNVLSDVFFGTDYHSHLGTQSGGLAAYDAELGLQRKIHSINNAPFRTKFEWIFDQMRGTAAIGCINDTDPQPLVVRSRLGTYAVCFVGVIRNAQQLIHDYIETAGGQLNCKTGGGVNATELLAALINQKDNFVDGIRYAQSLIEGSATILILTEKGSIIAARDTLGRTPIMVGKSDDGYAVSFEHFAYLKTGYVNDTELKSGEIVEFTADKRTTLYAGTGKMKICSFLWSYYGFSTSTYEGVNVEAMRYKNGEIMAENDRANGILPDADYICGVPDSGTPHAIGYANQSGMPFGRAFIKYTPTWPRSFMPTSQQERNRVAKMKQVPVHELIRDKELLFVDDSIVRGTQMRETVEFLYENGVKKLHMRSACPPIMFGCKYLNFSRSTSEDELIARQTIRALEGEEGLKHLAEYADASSERAKRMHQGICEKLHCDSLAFQTLEGLIKAIGIDRECLCTYCWDGKE